MRSNTALSRIGFVIAACALTLITSNLKAFASDGPPEVKAPTKTGEFSEITEADVEAFLKKYHVDPQNIKGSIFNPKITWGRAASESTAATAGAATAEVTLETISATFVLPVTIAVAGGLGIAYMVCENGVTPSCQRVGEYLSEKMAYRWLPNPPTRITHINPRVLSSNTDRNSNTNAPSESSPKTLASRRHTHHHKVESSVESSVK
jgi:hypothetical protein